MPGPGCRVPVKGRKGYKGRKGHKGHKGHKGYKGQWGLGITLALGIRHWALAWVLGPGCGVPVKGHKGHKGYKGHKGRGW